MLPVQGHNDLRANTWSTKYQKQSNWVCGCRLDTGQDEQKIQKRIFISIRRSIGELELQKANKCCFMTEAEYIALAKGLWIYRLLKDFEEKIEKGIVIYEDLYVPISLAIAQNI